MRTIVFYISGHGFGHAVRCIEVINALSARQPELRIIVRTTAARWLFELTVRADVVYHHLETDTGVAQIDSLHLDAPETVSRARAFMATFEARVDEEAAFLGAERARLVVADLPALGVAAGARAGVPAIALGNFTWDWIYSAYPESADIVSAIGDAYRTAALALRLPMHGGFDVFPTIIDLPFIARRSTRPPEETRRRLALPLQERLVLVSFGGYGLDGLDLGALRRLEGYVALVSGRLPLGDLPEGLGHTREGQLMPFDERRMYAEGCRYEDLVRAVDVVISKPGYGIIAECLANDTALLYTSRGHFIEYDVLVAEMPRMMRAGFIDHADLFAGRWQPHLDALVAQRAPAPRPATDGADVAARILLDRI